MAGAAALEASLATHLHVAARSVSASLSITSSLGPSAERGRLLRDALAALEAAQALTAAAEADAVAAPARKRRAAGGGGATWFQGDELRLVLAFLPSDELADAIEGGKISAKDAPKLLARAMADEYGDSLCAVAAVNKAGVAAAAGAWEDLVLRESPSARDLVARRKPGGAARLLRRLHFKCLRYLAVAPATPRRILGCVEFIVGGRIKASSQAEFIHSGWCLHRFEPGVPFSAPSPNIGGDVNYAGKNPPYVTSDFEVRAVAVADGRYACSWTGHADERREWQKIDPIEDRDEPYFESMLSVLAGVAPLDEHVQVGAIYRPLCIGGTEDGRRSDLTTVVLMRKDPTEKPAGQQHRFYLQAVLMVRTSWDYADETGGIFRYDGSDAANAAAFWHETWRPNDAGDPALPWARVDGW